MTKQEKQEKRPVGRPPLPMPEQIPDTPENVAKAFFSKPVGRDYEWKYEKEKGKKNARHQKQ